MKKITILALHLGYGGIESCIVNLANLLVDNYDVKIFVTYKLYQENIIPIDSRVKIVYLTKLKPNKEEFKTALKKFNVIRVIKEGLKSIHILILKRLTMIKALKNDDADITISTRIYYNNLLGKYGHGLKIGWEHNHHHGYLRYINKFIKSCKNIQKVVLVSNSLKSDYSTSFKKNNISCECIYIPNFIDNMPVSHSLLNNNNLVSVGRISKEKGFEDLVDVYKIINDNLSNTYLNIIGDGVEFKNVKDQINYLNLNSQVKLHGFQKKDYINNIYLNSSLYLMTSYTESFGLVLLEAMSYGIPCVAFSSAEGANDIIIDGVNGYLIQDRNKEEMAKKVVYLLNNRDILNKMGLNAIDTLKKYDKYKIKNEWIKMFGD